MADRYVVIVPRSSPETYEYLSESFRSLPDVEVVLDRRGPSSAVRRLVERRCGVPRFESDAFGCRLIRVEASAVEEKAPNAGPVAPLRPGASKAPRLRLRQVSGLHDV